MIDSEAVRKILKAFENKDAHSIETVLLHQRINPSQLIPNRGVSLLHLIIGHQSENFALKVTKLFLRCGADPNVRSTDGVTPTHVAAGWGRNRILHLLLVNGGDPWLQDEEKKNAFNYAFEEREWNTIEMLHHFHRMHSAANSKQDITPKYERDLERVVLRKGEEVFAFAPKSTKSMTTQTQNETPPSPIQDKIKYFEPSLEPRCQRVPEKHIGWTKDFYQTSCEVMVHCNASDNPENEKKETFVSSIHIDTSPVNLSPVVEKPTNTSKSTADIREQLFIELQEAVRRRSKLKMLSEKREENPVREPSMEKEVSYLYGVNLKESGMLKNMSDFATKVRKEVEISESDHVSEKTIDLCTSSADLTTAYLSCEEVPSQAKSVSQSFLLPHSNSENSNLYLTPEVSVEITRNEKKGDISSQSFTSVAEEYKYTDPEEGVVLLEKKLVITPTIRRLCSNLTSVDDTRIPQSFPNIRSFVSDDECIEENDADNASTTSSISACLSYNSDALRSELNGLGYTPGPVTKTTKKLYLKKLWRLKKEMARTPLTEKENVPRVTSPALEKTLTSLESFEAIHKYRLLEEEMTRSFENWTKSKWREGNNKTSFNYLLLDPRISLNLPKRASTMTNFDAWKCFLSAIFYVGKGKRSRPYSHLYQATSYWEKRSSKTPDEKTETIIEIWKANLGVVCLHVFQNIMPVEAFTREAAMLEAVGVDAVKNIRRGEYYGVVSTWASKDKVKLGIYLLYKAMLIFLNEGERQIKPYDID